MEFRRDGSPLRPLCSEGQVRKPRTEAVDPPARTLSRTPSLLPPHSRPSGLAQQKLQEGEAQAWFSAFTDKQSLSVAPASGLPGIRTGRTNEGDGSIPPPQMSPAERTSYRRRRPLWASRPRPVLGEREAALCHRLPGRSLQISLVRGGSQSSRSAAAKDRLGAAAPFRTLGENTYLPDNNRYQRTILIITVFGMAGLRLRLQNGSH